MSFYITLASNSSKQFYPNNTFINFTTKLHSTLRLDGEYEVGLVELSYPQNWKYRRNGSIVFKDKTKTEIFKVKFSNYETFESILQVLNEFCKSKSFPVHWHFNKNNSTISIQITNQIIVEFLDGIMRNSDTNII